MVETFDNDEAAYLNWVGDHPDGFVSNVDRAGLVTNYPMVHTTRHRAISSPKIGNFTTGDYFKFCSSDLATLEAHSQARFGRPLTRCAVCM